MGADRVKYIWTFKKSVAKPMTHYAIDLWSEGIYDLGESLALFMGFLEFDPDHPGRTRIAAHNDVWVDTGDNTRARFVVGRLDTREYIGRRLSTGWAQNFFEHSRRPSLLHVEQESHFRHGSLAQRYQCTHALCHTTVSRVYHGFRPRAMVNASAPRWLLTFLTMDWKK